MNYIEFILLNTENNKIDKKIASYEFKRYYLKHRCRNNSFVRDYAKNISRLFLKNKYIDKQIKEQIISLFYNNSNKTYICVK